jgi:hypothetical protein
MKTHYLSLFRLTLILVGFGLFGSDASASTIRFTDRNITVTPGGGPVLSSYKMRFGSFAAGFMPTAANFSQWNANFNGSTGVHTPGLSTSTDFTAADNSVHTLQSTMFMMVFNISPSASIETATSAALLTRQDWVANVFGLFEQWGVDRRGNDVLREVEYNYQYGFIGVDVTDGSNSNSFRNFDEDNYLPLTDTSSFSSPANDIIIYNGGLGVSSSFSAVPEPSALSLLAIGLGGLVMIRRRRS